MPQSLTCHRTRRLLWAASVFAFASVPAAAAPADSVVRVFATIRDPDLLQPWNKRPAVEFAGSGVIIENKQILTNAHHVLYATEVYVQGEKGKKIRAEVKVIGPGIDLALLTVEEPDFFAARPPLPRSRKLPKEKSKVMVYGFPATGSKLSIVRDNIFRIDFASYSAQTSGMQLQIDRVVDAGTSGGPVLQGAEMIGVALRAGPRDVFGHVIPNQEIDVFLADVADGRYDGKPWLHVPLQKLENEALRRKLRLRASATGLFVSRDTGPLRKFDVLTKIGPFYIDNAGQILTDDDLRLPFQYMVPLAARNGKVRAGVLRDGDVSVIELPITRSQDFLIRELNGKYPPYFVYGPLVFSVATTEAAEQVLQLHPDPSSPLVRRQSDKVRFPGEELVVVTSVLPHKCLAGYQHPIGRVVQEVDGGEIKNLRHLVEKLRDGKSEFVTFGFGGDQGEVLVLARRTMEIVNQELMSKNKIPARASAELLRVWRAKR